ncbi:hypothetical protein [Aestuariivirga sp.]|uniref:hypothetical protein n=1 Tax=Aestuariivirga sp. TaxID=2650926 RepID=UPI0039E58FFF
MVTLEKLVQALAMARETAPEMPLGALVAFLAVANDEEKDQPSMLKDVAQRVDIPYTTVLRHLLFLSKIKEPGVEGLGLIDTFTWPLDRRQKYAKLTPRGRSFLARLMKMLG